MKRIIQSLVIALSGVIPSLDVHAGGSELIWDTSVNNINLSSSLGSLNEFGADNQVADDFDIVGAISRVVMHGKGCSSCGSPTVDGVFVRFFQWSEAGPGALQQEYFVAAGDPGFVYDPTQPSLMDVTLPEPFEAGGLHFVSVQPKFSVGGEWRVRQANLGVPTGSTLQHRANHISSAWQNDPAVTIAADASMELWGTLGAAPLIDTFDRAHHPSERIVIEGSYFGAEQGDRQLFIGGTPAWVITWSQSVIIGYVPEQISQGVVDVVVMTEGGASLPVPLEVAPRETDGRIKWRFAVDRDYMLHRPGIGPDGTVFISDLAGRLYAVSADGGLLWIADALRGQPGLGSNGPVAVGDDGTIYVGVEPLGPTDDLVAFNADGTVAWVYTDPDALGIAAGPAVGPDGNVYIAFHDSDQDSSGCTSLTPGGVLRWSNNGNPPLYEYGATGSELVFGASTPGGSIDQVVLTVDRNLDDAQLYGFDLATGAQNFNTVVGGLTNGFETQHQPAINSATGQIYLAQFTGCQGIGWNLRAFHPSGAFNWLFDPGAGAGIAAPDVGPDGTVYFAWDGGHLTALYPDGSQKWLHESDESFDDGPIVSPNNQVIAVGGGTALGPWSLRGIAPGDGELLWRVELPQENGGHIITQSRPGFTPDSNTIYVPTSNGGSLQYEYCYLYAIDASLGLIGDLDNNDVVDVFDLLILLDAWGTKGPGADLAPPLDIVDVFDLLEIFGNWT